MQISFKITHARSSNTDQYCQLAFAYGKLGITDYAIMDDTVIGNDLEQGLFSELKEPPVQPLLVHMVSPFVNGNAKNFSLQRQKQNVIVSVCARKPQTSEMLNFFTTQSDLARAVMIRYGFLSVL